MLTAMYLLARYCSSPRERWTWLVCVAVFTLGLFLELVSVFIE